MGSFICTAASNMVDVGRIVTGSFCMSCFTNMGRPPFFGCGLARTSLKMKTGLATFLRQPGCLFFEIRRFPFPSRKGPGFIGNGSYIDYDTFILFLSTAR